MTSISVVLPAYNEEVNIQPQVENVVQVFLPIAPDLEIIVVNDGSRDKTSDVVRALTRQYPQVRLVEHPKNRGYGAALYSGFMAAQKEWVFLTDADRQFDLSEIEYFLPQMAENDLIVGYRSPRRDPFYRLLYGWGWNSLVAFLFGFTVRDVDCAFKLFKREILDHINIQSRGATFSAEFLVRAKRAGCKFYQIPVSHHPRRAGKPTGARLQVIVRAFCELLQMRLALWRGQ